MPGQSEKFTDLVRTTYQEQDARIRVGNRLVDTFRKKLGVDDDEPTSDEQKEVLREVQRRYKLVTDGIARKEISDVDEERFKYDGVIDERAEVIMCTNYFRHCDNEEDLFSAIRGKVQSFPIWREFLEDVNGIGPAMSGVIISEFDPRKGKYVSSFWKYAGLDTVETWHRVEDGELTKVEEPPQSATFNDARDEARKNGKTWKTKRIARSRRDQHLEEEEYEDADGNTQTRRTITFNKFLHDKLLGVAGPCMMRGRGHYKDVYDDYKGRIKNMDRHSGKSDGHLHRMAIRYMVKMFVKDLYEAWRPLVGKEVYDPYRVSKLGKEPHGKGQ